MRFIPDPALSPGIYQHFKGGTYHVLGVAEHTETHAKLVVYLPLEGEFAGLLRVRPLAMFEESFSREDYPGWDRRFKLLASRNILADVN